jgi:hypothetical protein
MASPEDSLDEAQVTCNAFENILNFRDVGKTINAFLGKE